MTDKIIRFKRPEAKKECEHENIRVNNSKRLLICTHCHESINPYFVINEFMKCVRWSDTLSVKDIEYLSGIAVASMRVERLEEMRSDLDKQIHDKFKELHSLEIQIKEKKSQVNLF